MFGDNMIEGARAVVKSFLFVISGRYGSHNAALLLNKHGVGDVEYLSPYCFSGVIDDAAEMITLANFERDNRGNDIPEARTKAFELINGERDYQDVAHPHPAGLTGYLIVLEKLVQDAKLAWYTDKDNDDVRAHMRKIAASAVRCLEAHGAPEREPPYALTTKG